MKNGNRNKDFNKKSRTKKDKAIKRKREKMKLQGLSKGSSI